MRYQLRIIGGQLRRRKLTVSLDPALRPISDRVREALFNILGDAVPYRPFFDVFAGSGVVGMEALSRRATSAEFIERDPRTASNLSRYLQHFGLKTGSRVIRADAYRWVERWSAPAEPATIFVGPPYAEFDRNFAAVAQLARILQAKVAVGSVLILQSDQTFAAERLPDAGRWDVRCYGRTQLAIWTKPE